MILLTNLTQNSDLLTNPLHLYVCLSVNLVVICLTYLLRLYVCISVNLAVILLTNLLRLAPV